MTTGPGPQIADLKQRLIKLGMLEPGSGDHHRLDVILGVQQDDQELVRQRILEALNRPASHQIKADALVPRSGHPPSINAVFIKGGADVGGNESKIKLMEMEDISVEQRIKKSALIPNQSEMSSITLGLIEDGQMEIEMETETGPEMEMEMEEEAPKSPQGRKFYSSWLAYLYGRSSGSCSPVPSPTIDPQDQARAEIAEMLCRRPQKSILKTSKVPGEVLDLPPPVKKSVFLRQEEVQRLTKFTQSLRNGASRRSISITAASEEGKVKATSKVQFCVDRNEQGETWSRTEYDRAGVEYVAKSLTPEIAMMIKRELNEVKKEMEVHEESQVNTQFYILR